MNTKIYIKKNVQYIIKFFLIINKKINFNFNLELIFMNYFFLFVKNKERKIKRLLASRVAYYIKKNCY